MQDPHPIKPFTSPANAAVSVPGSKSITNRALILAALSDGQTRLENCLFSEDTEIMVSALRDLGFRITTDSQRKTIEVEGKAGDLPNKNAKLHVGNSGTSARFLTALCCLGDGGVYELDGVEQMRKRPIQSLADSLANLGAEIETTNGFFPLKIRPRGLSGGKAIIDATGSSQLVSALLMVAPLAKNTLDIELSNTKVRRGYIDMTLQMMRIFGLPEDQSSSSESGYTIHPLSSYTAKTEGYFVEGDASAASYFFALPLAVGGQIEIRGVKKNSLQGDIGFAQKAASVGAELQWSEGSAICRYDLVEKGKADAFKGNFYAISDTFLTAAAISPLLNGETFIEGIEHTRHQECDRISAMAEGLERAGQKVKEEAGSIAVQPQTLTSARIDTYRDHRVAMSFAILGCYDANANGKPWLQIQDPLCCRKTFPEFFNVLEKARRDSVNESVNA